MKLSKGFTLIELLVIIIIVGFFLSMAGAVSYPMFHRYEATGTISEIAKLPPAIGINGASGQNYSFSIDLKAEDDEIISVSSEDRKFATCEKGQKIKMAYNKYPPWNFSKAGTFYNGRMLKKYTTQ